MLTQIAALTIKNMSSEDTGRRWQFSLRSFFFFAVLIVGPVAGVVAPIILESITEWKPPPRPMPIRRGPGSIAPVAEMESYFESGETPLY
ncbi:MAG: hypothetical protein O3C40_19720 [Planctomycetota bacterium]|nr:hypothetical protein [Planctomycetota bacterium]